MCLYYIDIVALQKCFVVPNRYFCWKSAFWGNKLILFRNKWVFYRVEFEFLYFISILWSSMSGLIKNQVHFFPGPTRSFMPWFLVPQCSSWARKPSSSTAAWRRWRSGRTRSTTSCGRRSSRPTGTCGGSPTIPSTGSGAGRRRRWGFPLRWAQ